MATKRPYKVRYHYDTAIGGTQPINGTKAEAEEAGAHRLAREVSRNGGSATITYRNPATGIETLIKSYEPTDA